MYSKHISIFICLYFVYDVVRRMNQKNKRRLFEFLACRVSLIWRTIEHIKKEKTTKSAEFGTLKEKRERLVVKLSTCLLNDKEIFYKSCGRLAEVNCAFAYAHLHISHIYTYIKTKTQQTITIHLIHIHFCLHIVFYYHEYFSVSE